MKKIARVFPTKTNQSPIDQDVYFDSPSFWATGYDEVHISVAFTWDKERGLWLKAQWEMVCDNVKIGGPAFGDPGGEFVSGKYLKPEVTITSRGCPNNCPFCFVPQREGKIRELPIVPGRVIQDNNLTACSRNHVERVFRMLRKQKRVDFAGGLEAARITDWFVGLLRGIKVYQIWLAYDRPSAEKPLIKAVEKLSQYFNRDKLRCYVLVGYEDDTIEKAEVRLRRAWEIGCLPFAMLYRDENARGPTGKGWKSFQWQWARVAVIKSRMRSGGHR